MGRYLDETERASCELTRRAAWRLDRRALMRRGGRGAGGRRGGGATDAPKLYAVTAFTDADHLRTGPGGGEAGVDTGFGIVQVYQMATIPGVVRHFNNRQSAAPNGGHFFYFDTNGRVVAAMVNGSNAWAYAGQYPPAPSDLGRIHVWATWYRAGYIEMMLDGVQQQPYGCSGYTPAASVVEFLGAYPSPGYASGGIAVLGRATWRGAPTNAQVLAYCNALRSSLTLPATIAGGTITHRNWVGDEVVTDGQTAPTIRDSITLAAVDALAPVGSPKVKAIDPVDRLWGYETTPILYGGKTFALSAYWSHPTAMRGVATGFTVGLYWTCESATATSKNRVYLSNMDVPGTITGWLVYSSGTNSSINFSLANGAGSIVSAPAVAITPNDVGRQFLSVFVFDGTRVRQYIRRVESGSGTATTGFTPSANPVMVGRDPRAGSEQPATDACAIHGWFYDSSAWTLADVQAAHDAVLANDDIQVLAGKTALLVSLTRDARDNAGAFPAQALDRVGSAHFTRNGNPAQRVDYARTAGW